MLGTCQLGRVFAEAGGAGSKLGLVGDVQQLQAIEAGAAFRLLAERHGAAEIGEVRRQESEWMRAATRDLANGRVGEALAAYTDAGMVQSADSRDAARAAPRARWDAERRAHPGAARTLLTNRNKAGEMVNAAARQRPLPQDE